MNVWLFLFMCFFSVNVFGTSFVLQPKLVNISTNRLKEDVGEKFKIVCDRSFSLEGLIGQILSEMSRHAKTSKVNFS